MRRLMILAAALVAAGLSSGCSLNEPECGLLNGGIYVTLTDAATGQPIQDAVEVSARDGDERIGFFRLGAGEYASDSRRGGPPPGDYVLTITGAGYQTVTRTLSIAPIRCGGDVYSETVYVEIALTPVPS